MAEETAILIEYWAEEDMNELNEKKYHPRLVHGNSAQRTSGNEKELEESPQSNREICSTIQRDTQRPS